VSDTRTSNSGPSTDRPERSLLRGRPLDPVVLAILAAVVLMSVLVASEPVPATLAVLGIPAVPAGLMTAVRLPRPRRPSEADATSRTSRPAGHRRAQDDARRDALTGLGSQLAFQQDVRDRLRAAEEFGEPFTLVLLDLDDLRLVNDREGRIAGDATLRAMAAAMLQVTRPGDGLFRVQDDEFAIILPCTDAATAQRMTEQLLTVAWRPYEGSRISPFSAGITAAPQFGRDPELLYRQAHAALAWVKRHGRGAVEVYDPERDRLPDRADESTRAAVQEVVESRLLVPVFQPIVDLRTGRVLGFEGLIRPHPSGPMRDTAQLFAAAAATGRTVELDVACVEQVLIAARAIGPDRLLTLNLSPRTLEVRDFDAGWLLQGLYRAGISPSRVILELTEREEIDDLARLQRAFQHLRQYGLRVAADDVGAGNSGLRLLSQVHFDIVKLDLSLVHSGVRRMGARAVLQSLRDLALDQHAHVVAEGVETREQLDVIRELQIGAGQGYLLGRPGASVSASFIDVDHVGELSAAPLVAPPSAFTPLALAGDTHASPRNVGSLDGRRTFVLRGPRQGGLVGTPGPV
jgi:diguanylate cyclase (GGDEF)-like protein